MSPSKEKSPSELNTWPEIASYLGVSPRTAQNWEKELGLPIRRITEGPRGRVLALTLELDEWRQRRLADSSPTPEGAASAAAMETFPPESQSAAPARLGQDRQVRPQWRRWVLVVSGALVLGCILLMSLVVYYRNSRQVAMVVVEGPFVIAKDTTGSELWRHFFKKGIYNDLYATNPLSKFFWVGNLNGTSGSDVLFHYFPPLTSSESSLLMCFDRTGHLKWEFRVGRRVRDVTGEIPPPFHIDAFIVISSPRTHETRIVAGSGHPTDQAFQVAFLDVAGRLTAEYWHPGVLGHLQAIHVGPGDSVRLLAAGVNNGEHRATIVILDPFSIKGVSTPSRMRDQRFRLLDMPEANEEMVVLFPRTCLSLFFKVPYNRIANIQIDDVAVHSSLIENYAGNRLVYYDLDPQFQVKRAFISSQYREEHVALENSGAVKHSWHEDEAAMAKGFEYRPTTR